MKVKMKKCDVIHTRRCINKQNIYKILWTKDLKDKCLGITHKIKSVICKGLPWSTHINSNIPYFAKKKSFKFCNSLLIFLYVFVNVPLLFLVFYFFIAKLLYGQWVMQQKSLRRKQLRQRCPQQRCLWAEYLELIQATVKRVPHDGCPTLWI